VRDGRRRRDGWLLLSPNTADAVRQQLCDAAQRAAKVSCGARELACVGCESNAGDDGQAVWRMRRRLGRHAPLHRYGLSHRVVLNRHQSSYHRPRRRPSPPTALRRGLSRPLSPFATDVASHHRAPLPCGFVVWPHPSLWASGSSSVMVASSRSTAWRSVSASKAKRASAAA